MKMERGERECTENTSTRLTPKGRLFVPSKLRDELGERFLCDFRPRSLPVGLHGGPDGSAILDKYNALRRLAGAQDALFFLPTPPNASRTSRARFLHARPNLRQYAGIRQEVTFIGQGGHAEIWDSEAYDKLEQETLTPENLAQVMEELGF